MCYHAAFALLYFRPCVFGKLLQSQATHVCLPSGFTAKIFLRSSFSKADVFSYRGQTSAASVGGGFIAGVNTVQGTML